MNIGTLTAAEYELRMWYFDQCGVLAAKGTFEPDTLQFNTGPEISRVVFSRQNFQYFVGEIPTANLKAELIAAGLTEEGWKEIVAKCSR